MGIFSRFKDIVSANINAMLDKAEDPELLIRLMIQEMEETLVELKTSCAGLIADRKRVQREIDQLRAGALKWEQRAALAVDKERDDLAREALLEKQRLLDIINEVSSRDAQFEHMIAQAREDIARLEKKILNAREKQRLLVQRHHRAGERIRTENQIRRAGSYEAERKFDAFEQRIDRMEAESGLINGNERKSQNSLENEFERLERKQSVESELAALKAKVKSES